MNWLNNVEVLEPLEPINATSSVISLEQVETLLSTSVNRLDLIATILLIALCSAVAIGVVYILYKAVDKLMTY